MAVLKINSTNPNLSHVLQKNPATQAANNAPFSTTVTGNKVYMWFENPQSVIAMYRVNPRNQESNLDYSQYSDGRSYLLILDNILRTAYSKDHEFDTPDYETEVQFSLYNHRQTDYSKTFKSVVNQVTKNNHSLITIKTNSIKESLETVALLSISSCLHDPAFYLHDSQFTKYLQILVKHVKEYSMLRSFVSAITSTNLFASIQNILDQTPFKFQLKNGLRNRRSHLTDLFSKSTSSHLLDLGCGRGQYFKSEAKHYDLIIAVEIDETEFKVAERSVNKFQLQEKISVVHQSIQDYLNPISKVEDTDILLTEVLEHVDFNEAVKITKSVLDIDPNNIFITLPNKDFNQFYGLSNDEVRHDDHKWEPNYQEAVSLFDSILKEYPQYKVKYSFIGDSLKDNPDVHTTTLIVISKV